MREEITLLKKTINEPTLVSENVGDELKALQVS